MQNTEKQDIYGRITDQIISHLEKGVRPWVRAWNAEHAAVTYYAPLALRRDPHKCEAKFATAMFRVGVQWITRDCSDGG